MTTIAGHRADAPAPVDDFRCAIDGRLARYVVDVAEVPATNGGPVRRSLLCLACWLEHSGSIPGLVGARQLR